MKTKMAISGFFSGYESVLVPVPAELLEATGILKSNVLQFYADGNKIVMQAGDQRVLDGFEEEFDDDAFDEVDDDCIEPRCEDCPYYCPHCGCTYDEREEF